MRGALVLVTLLTTSAESDEIRKKRRLSLTCCLHARSLPKENEVHGYVDDQEELLGIDIGSLNRFIGSSE